VRFGLFYEHQLPRPWTDGDEEKLLSNALEQIELADRLGYDYVWEVEHHFLEEYSHSSAPEVFLAAASQRTRRIRLGHGIVQLPHPINHPARIAERIATLDLVSGGRVDFGTGEGSSQAELAAFGVARDTKKEQWEEALDATTRMMVEEPFAGYDGTWLKMPVRNVVPKPKQKPHPPLWAACSRRDTILAAAKKGIGALSFSFVEPEEAAPWVDDYYSIIESAECVPGGFSVNANLAVVVPFMCCEDEKQAIERGIDGAHFFGYSLAHYYVFGQHKPGRTNIASEFASHRSEQGFARDLIKSGGAPLGVRILEQGLGSMRGAVGTPDQIADLVSRYEKAGVDQIIFVAQAGSNQHEHVCEALELFGNTVLPEYAARADEIEKVKEERLGEAFEAALARREPPRTAPEYVVSPSGEDAPAPVYEGAARRSSGATTRSAGLGVRRRLRRSGEAAFQRFVAASDDARLERFVGSSTGLKILFKGMEDAFVPAKAGDFDGEIQYELTGRDGERPWVLKISGGRARTRPGRSASAQVTLRMPVPVFARIAAGDLEPARAFLEQQMQIEGSLETATKLAEMFGRTSPY
jgi:alkanesulfonate monooxygenase SsuD/methylene tetrahydromethanopterin reductase-like flavin-dependent oxidoreductase (luciferase family)/putative sterol carrier protein